MIRRTLQRFFNAHRGLRVAWQREASFRAQGCCALVAILAGVFFRLTRIEWAILFLVIGAVLGLELMNSALERTVDLLRPRLHPLAADAKDLMAAAVWIASAVSIVIGALIFWDHLRAIL